MSPATEIAALQSWLLTDARSMELAAAIEALGYRLKALGVPLDRFTVALSLINPSLLAASIIWKPGKPIAFTRYSYSERNSGMYDRSPFRIANETKRWYTIDVPNTPDDAFGIVPDLKADGIVEYIAMPLPDSVGGAAYATMATTRQNGFTAEERAIVAAILPAVAAITEIKTLRSTFREVLAAYVGPLPAAEIVSGTVHLGQVTEVRAAILVVDLRGFTHLSARLPPEATADLINRYYDVVVPPIMAHGGEVLKYVGDAVLAIFPIAQRGEDAAVLAALDAARAALDVPADPFMLAGIEVAIHFGIAVHVGEAAFGNVGSGDRLDFTVIGRDVNVAARIAALCSRLGRDYLVSSAVAEIGRRHGRAMANVGAHAVRGLDEPLRVFVPDTTEAGVAFDDGISVGPALVVEG